jgi:hypothetical protein
MTFDPSQALHVMSVLAGTSLANTLNPTNAPLLDFYWMRAGHELGFSGEPRHRNSEIARESRMIVAVYPENGRSLGLLVRDPSDYLRHTIFLPRAMDAYPHAFRWDYPVHTHPHARRPLSDEDANGLTGLAVDGGKRIVKKSYVRILDLLRPESVKVDHKLVSRLAGDPSILMTGGALKVTRTFDASDWRSAPSPSVRYVLGGEKGAIEAAVAAHLIGMEWVQAEEDLSVAHALGIFGYTALADGR